MMERPPTTYTALSDRELEVLRLLAAGHTVKSIAVQIDRTEASINERLRDARRKTGVGSSRELARLLDAQKIWDKNIDLSIGDGPVNSVQQPPGTGRTRLKGKTIMLLAIPAAAAAGLLAWSGNPAPPAAVPQNAPTAQARLSPLVGSWSLDIMKIPADERPSKMTISFRVSPDQKWTTRVEMVGPDGKVMSAESTAALDGVPVPISGNMPFIDSASLRQPAPNTLVMTLGKNGAPVSTRVYAVSKDQQTMTETIVWAGQNIPRLETTHYRRIN